MVENFDLQAFADAVGIDSARNAKQQRIFEAFLHSMKKYVKDTMTASAAMSRLKENAKKSGCILSQDAKLVKLTKSASDESVKQSAKAMLSIGSAAGIRFMTKVVDTTNPDECRALLHAWELLERAKNRYESENAYKEVYDEYIEGYAEGRNDLRMSEERKELARSHAKMLLATAIGF